MCWLHGPLGAPADAVAGVTRKLEATCPGLVVRLAAQWIRAPIEVVAGPILVARMVIIVDRYTGN
jgi:hypothetical protein